MILNSYIDTDAQLENIYIDTNNASFKLDGYIQLLFDEYKGK